MMLVTLQRIVEGVNKEPDFSMALSTMVGQVREALETDSCSVFLADNDQKQFVMAMPVIIPPTKNSAIPTKVFTGAY